MSETPIALEARRSDRGRLFSPSAGRNKADIAMALSKCLPMGADVLEIGSGTGEHGIETVALRPDITWQFSDPDSRSRESQAAWATHAPHDFPAPLNLDMSDPMSLSQIERGYDVIFSANMIHIAPISALYGLAELATLWLNDAGSMILYGPFLLTQFSAASNLEFDASLRRRNPEWGVRDLEAVKHIFAKHGLNSVTRSDMPKNNFLLEMSRR